MATNSQIAFAPLGKTIAITANTTAPDGVQALVSKANKPQSAGEYRVVNASDSIVHLGVGVTSAAAKANAVGATSGSPAAGIPLLPNSTQILRFNPISYFSAAAGASKTIYITPGQGL